MMNSAINKKDIITPRLQLVAWELTRSCNLYCAHCRGSASHGQYYGELSTEECFKVIDQILEVGNPILILTGGEPLLRQDILKIASYGTSRGMRVVMGSNGTLLNDNTAADLKAVPIARMGISLDFPTADLQDNFRGQAGAFEQAITGIDSARQAGIDIQINSTITKLNVNYLDDLVSLALEKGAVAFHPFLLVPTGRGKGLEAVELSPQEYEDTLNWIYDRQQELDGKMFFKPTDAPHYLRIMKQRQKQDGQQKPPDPAAPASGQGSVHSITRGCLAGTGFCFIDHRGSVRGCGYFDVEAGNIREATFGEVWENSPLFGDLRDLSKLKGKCGDCEYKRICGGCRARAYETSGDYLEAEPYCIYQPPAWRRKEQGAIN
ncbi:MAG: radical SAM protein [Dehalococcoidales bacterium]